MKRVAIIGGGLTGLTMAKLLEPHDVEVVVLESSPHIGGLCKTKMINGVPIDIGGGHIFNSKYPEVRDWVFALMPASRWNKFIRNPTIMIGEELIPYPFELNFRYLGKEQSRVILADMIEQVKQNATPNNLAEYFSFKYGETASKMYFHPYNNKIWGNPRMSGFSWIDPSKTPTTNIDEIINAYVDGDGKNETMSHHHFYYPNSSMSGISSFIDKLRTSNVLSQVIVREINFAGGVYEIRGTGLFLKAPFDIVINTAPLDDLLESLKIRIADDLRTSKVSVLVCETDFFRENPDTSWVYVPDPKFPFHRIANPAYCIDRARGLATIETTTPPDSQTDKFKFGGHNFRIIHRFHNDNSYPIEPLGGRDSIDRIVSLLECGNIFSIGRWGRHKYLNMDLCIYDAMQTRNKLVERGLIA